MHLTARIRTSKASELRGLQSVFSMSDRSDIRSFMFSHLQRRPDNNQPPPAVLPLMRRRRIDDDEVEEAAVVSAQLPASDLHPNSASKPIVASDKHQNRFVTPGEGYVVIVESEDDHLILRHSPQQQSLMLAAPQTAELAAYSTLRTSKSQQSSKRRKPGNKKKKKQESRIKCKSRTPSKRCKSRFLDDEAEDDSDFIDDASIDESDSDAARLVKQAATSLRNRRSFAEHHQMCALCKDMRVVFLRLLGLD